MNLFLRCFWVWISSFFKKRLEILDRSTLRFRVWPHDLDVYGHMNNGRYLTVMDLGRLDLILRTGLGKVAKKYKWNPIVGSSFMRYRRPLHVFEDFELQSRIVGWSGKWFFIEQSFVKESKVFARGFIKGLLLGPHGSIDCDEIFREMGLDIKSPPLPEALSVWLQSSEEIGESGR